MGKRTKWARWTPINEGRCVRLRDDGVRCRKKAQWRGPVFCDDATGGMHALVTVDLCNEHSSVFPSLWDQETESEAGG